MNETIPAKLHLGDHTITHDIIPQGVTALGDWAYAHCRSLSMVALPSSVKQLGRDVFLGCDGLWQVYCYAEPVFPGALPSEDPPYLAACLNAYAMRCFPDPLPLLFSADPPLPKTLALWDENCLFFCQQPPDLTFRPFLAGGEEDYTEGEDQYDAHLRGQNRLRAGMLYLRLLLDRISCFPFQDEKRELFFSLFRSNPEALSLLSQISSHHHESVALYKEAGLLSPETLPAIIASLPPSRVEMKAALLSLQSGSILDALSL
ncbi:MAG: leucine-rich repeat domain-containing protein [Lachnospiraceae bacterium]|nr:leucine-rich repeat domain-containing protein [Lachnospiraceae bacterium]